jgi:hypothetical protein
MPEMMLDPTTCSDRRAEVLIDDGLGYETKSQKFSRPFGRDGWNVNEFLYKSRVSETECGHFWSFVFPLSVLMTDGGKQMKTKQK